MNNAIVLCSGGLDSVVLAHFLKKVKKIENLVLLFIDYGQKALQEELFCAKEASKDLNSGLNVIDMRWLGVISTSLINKKNDEDINKKEDLISWYVPCRNSLFLLIGLAITESEFISKNEIYDVYLGIKYEGELRFKDTTPEFLEKMNSIIPYCTQSGNFKFQAPFLDKEKEELIKLANEMNLKLKNTYSCYIGSGFDKIKSHPVHCGICVGCKARKKAFKFSEVKDPTIYAK